VHALAATGEAFLALSWETSALRHYAVACQHQQIGPIRSWTHLLKQIKDDLDTAYHCWGKVLLWLEALANNPTMDAIGDDLETVRPMIHLACMHQRHIGHLLKEVQG